MFATFKQGADDLGSWNDDSPAFAPGRFHAHAVPSASTASSGPRAASVPFPSAPLPQPGPRASHTRRRSRNRFIRPLFPAALSEDGGPRSPLLNGFLSSFGGLGGGEAIVEERDEDDDEGHGWLRPGRKRVERWMNTWWRRWAVLVGAPCLIIWLWCSIPFPVADPYKEEPPWHIPWPPSTDPPAPSHVAVPFQLPSRVQSDSPPIPAAAASVEVDRRSLLEAQQVFEVQYAANNKASESALSAKEALPEQDFLENGGDDRREESLRPGSAHAPDRSASGTKPDEDLPVDANFFFFLFVYYGTYLAIALVFVTKLFDLYRLNWWPSTLGGSVSYTFFWSLALAVGYLLHHFDLDGFGRRTRSRHPRPSDEWDWERKTTWVLLAFATIFLERQLGQRMPRSYRRFLWFLGTLGLSLLALIIGQLFATTYLSTLPHNNLEGLAYVYTWILSVTILNGVSSWILQRKVRSQALVFLFRFYFFLVYHVFYRNLFARLRSPDQAAWITLLSSSIVIVVYPVTMSRTFWRILRFFTGLDLEWEDYAAEKGQELYLRNLSEVVTMVAFLGWLSILHWGPNKTIYPFFAFDTRYDPYTYRLTLTASAVIFAAELFSSYIARLLCWVCYGVDVTNLGLDQFREHPELVVACVFTACHVLSDMLLFLVKLNFR
ncbi:hypothetical protein JCM10213v2_004946 [Rhodosporidiobolus nylandii]